MSNNITSKFQLTPQKHVFNSRLLLATKMTDVKLICWQGKVSQFNVFTHNLVCNSREPITDLVSHWTSVKTFLYSWNKWNRSVTSVMSCNTTDAFSLIYNGHVHSCSQPAHTGVCQGHRSILAETLLMQVWKYNSEEEEKVKIQKE